MRQTSCGSGSRRRFGVTRRGTSKFRWRRQALIMAQEKADHKHGRPLKIKRQAGGGVGIARRRPSTQHSGFGSGISKKFFSASCLPPRILNSAPEADLIQADRGSAGPSAQRRSPGCDPRMTREERMPQDFEGKTVVVTGAGKGIGLAIARMLAARGAEVVAISRSQADLDALAADLGCRIIAADLADAEATRDAAGAALPADLLVNCAGTTILESFLDVNPESFDHLIAVNTRAPLIIAQEYAAIALRSAVVARSSICRAARPSPALPTMPPIAPPRAR